MALIDGLVSYYEFETDVTDSHGGNNGTDQGTADVAGKINRARYFNGGESDYVTVPNAVITGTAGSVVAWIYADSLPGAGSMIFTAGLAVNPWIFFYAASNGQLIYSTFGGTPFVTATGKITTGSWIHVAYTSDGSASSELYVNGDPESTGGDQGGWFDDIGFTQLAIGILDRTTDYGPFDGKIDEVGIWNRKLTDAEVAQLWNSGSGLAYPFTLGTNAQINIGDAWKEVPAMQINIGDAWKEVASAQINIGDAWKSIF